MILLGLLAIAFLSLATVTVRTSNQDRAQEEARANARMLNLTIKDVSESARYVRI
jgi:hypothetical protein